VQNYLAASLNTEATLVDKRKGIANGTCL
jgi:hypothetical protein